MGVALTFLRMCGGFFWLAVPLFHHLSSLQLFDQDAHSYCSACKPVDTSDAAC